MSQLTYLQKELYYWLVMYEVIVLGHALYGIDEILNELICWYGQDWTIQFDYIGIPETYNSSLSRYRFH